MSVNKVILVGRLGADPESRATPGGLQVSNLRVATNHVAYDRDGNKNESTEWHRVVFFGRQAEVCEQYLRKGSQVYVEGRLRTNKYTDKNGIERYSTDVNANELQMLGGGNYNPNNPDGRHVDDLSMDRDYSQQNRQPHQQNQQQSNPNTAYWDRPENGGSNGFDMEDDDVPF